MAVSERLDDALSGVDSVGSLLVTLAYGLYRLPLSLGYGALLALAVAPPDAAFGLLLLLAGLVAYASLVVLAGVAARYGTAALSASEGTVMLAVLYAVVFALLMGPVWLSVLYSRFVEQLPDPDER